MALTNVTKELMESLKEIIKSETKVKPKILLVEDNDNDSELLSNLLQREDCTVVITKTQETAQVVLLQEDIKFVFLDLNLSGNMEGLFILKYIRAHCPKLPVIIVSGFVTDTMFHDIKSLGYFAMIEKPLNKKELDLIFSHFRI